MSQQAESSGGPLRTTLSEIDRLIAKVAPKKNTKGTIAPETSVSKGKESKKPFWKIKASTYGTWEANNFPKRIYLN